MKINAIITCDGIIIITFRKYTRNVLKLYEHFWDTLIVYVWKMTCNSLVVYSSFGFENIENNRSKNLHRGRKSLRVQSSDSYVS